MEWNDRQIECLGLLMTILYGYIFIKLYMLVL